ncbi:MAG: hypothetical protein QXX79_02845 [Candidatus Bathyarchaeia archaeon]
MEHVVNKFSLSKVNFESKLDKTFLIAEAYEEGWAASTKTPRSLGHALSKAG